MSDLGSELKNAVLSSTAKTLKVVICGEQCSFTRENANRWFGKLEECNEGVEDIFLFRCDDLHLKDSLRDRALSSLARGAHVFEFNFIERKFVRRDKLWFERPLRCGWVWTHIKDNLTEAESDAKFG